MLTDILSGAQQTNWKNYLTNEVVLNITFGIRIRKDNGEVIRAIDHDQDLDLDINAGFGTETYNHFIGVGTRSSIDMSAAMEPSIFEMRGFLDAAGITKEDLEIGRYRNAKFWFFMFRWDDLTYDVIPFRGGHIGDFEYEEDFTVDFRTHLDRMENQFVSTQPTDCPFEFGGVSNGVSNRYCGVQLTALEWTPSTTYTGGLDGDGDGSVIVSSLAGGSPSGSPDAPGVWFELQGSQSGTSGATEPTWDTSLGGTTTDGDLTWTTIEARVCTVQVTAVTSASLFTVDYTGGQEFAFADGRITFLTGSLADYKEVIEDLSGGVIRTQLPLPFAPTVGDRLQLIMGCNKTMRGVTGDNGSPDIGSPTPASNNCNFHCNWRRYGGWHHKPGDKELLRATGRQGK